LQRILSALLLLGGLLLGGRPLRAVDPNHVNIALSQASFPDLAAQDVRAALDIWGRELSRNVKFNSTFTTEVYPDIESLAAAFRRGAADLAIMPSVDFFRVEGQMNAELGFVSTLGNHSPEKYLLIGPVRLAGRSWKDLKGLRFSYVRNDSVGLLFLNHALLSDGQQEMDRFFASVEAKANGSQALNSVFFGRTDACVVSEMAYHTAVTMNPQVGRSVTILRTSPELHGGLAVYRKGFSPLMRQRILDSVNGLKTYPRGAQILSLFRATEIRPATEESISETRRLYREYRQKKGRLM